MGMGCAFMPFPFSYLGVIVGGSVYQVVAWFGMIRKVTYKLSNWKARTFFVRGWLTFFKQLLGAFLTYFMSNFRDPVVILSQLQSMYNNLFQGQIWKREI